MISHRICDAVIRINICIYPFEDWYIRILPVADEIGLLLSVNEADIGHNLYQNENFRRLGRKNSKYAFDYQSLRM